MALTHLWLERCLKRFEETEPKYNYRQSFFPIVQGSTYKDLRKESTDFVCSKNAEGNAIGGLSVGEPEEIMYELCELVCNGLPTQKPRYLMGVGTPHNILNCISLGVDMFDCVMPTRNGRNGMLFTTEGIINIKNKKWATDFSPIDEGLGDHQVNHYSRAYLRHLFMAKEFLGLQLASLQNLSFYLYLVKEARQHIIEGDFACWQKEKIAQIKTRL